MRRHTAIAILSFVTVCLPISVHAASISGPDTSTSGTFTLTWTPNYVLRLQDANWQFANGDFTDLPSGTYKFQLWYCSFIIVNGFPVQSCTAEPNTTKTVIVTRDAEPAID